MMLAQWTRRAGVTLGSGAVHIAAALAFIISGSMTIIDHFRFNSARDVFSPPPPLLTFAPSPISGMAIEQESPVERPMCSPIRASVSPAQIVRQPHVEAHLAGRRDPRLCLRIGVNGRVLSARTLTSSGNAGADREAEALVRQLVFTPATQDGSPVASTATFEVVGTPRLQIYDANITVRSTLRK